LPNERIAGANENAEAMKPTATIRVGSSLLELLIALAIIAIMLTLLLPVAFMALKAAQNLGG